MSDTPRAQLIHIDVDRRLGHEWDEWDGKPLPKLGPPAPAQLTDRSGLELALGLGALLMALPVLPRLIPPPGAQNRAAATAAGFSIGTPIKLPYSVQLPS